MPKPSGGSEQLLCSFCGKSQRQVKKLIAGPGVYICDECIDLCNEIIDEELAPPVTLDLDNLPKPQEIYSVLSEYVIGQEEAKRTLSVAVYNHYKRVQMSSADDDVELAKSNILFICGGAFAGLEKIIERRIGKKGVGFGAHIEGKLDKDVGELFAQVLPEDLLEFGLIPEFIGRLPVVSNVHQLRRDDLVAILTEPKNALVKQYRKFFAYDGVDLIFPKDSLDAIADKAVIRDTGARGLRSIIEGALLNVMFELPSRRDVIKCVITKEVIERSIEPTLVTSAGREELELNEESA